jgi:hypothetical protein
MTGNTQRKMSGLRQIMRELFEECANTGTPANRELSRGLILRARVLEDGETCREVLVLRSKGAASAEEANTVRRACFFVSREPVKIRTNTVAGFRITEFKQSELSAIRTESAAKNLEPDDPKRKLQELILASREVLETNSELINRALVALEYLHPIHKSYDRDYSLDCWRLSLAQFPDLICARVCTLEAEVKIKKGLAA